MGAISKTMLVPILAAMLTGCASTPDKPSYTPPVVAQRTPDPTASIERAALIIGVLSTPSAGYGKPLLCPGADVDAQEAEIFARAAGITNVVVLRDQNTTKAQIKAAGEKLTAGFGEEDLLFVHYSGHGGRVHDYSGDEPSGWDSTWCIAGGQWLDDDVGAWVNTLPPCRIVFVADACHAEGAWRNADAPGIDLPRGFTWKGTLIQLAACTERESAWGNTLGGQWSIAVYCETASPTVAQWFADGKELIDGQTPVLQAYGPLADWALQQKPLE